MDVGLCVLLYLNFKTSGANLCRWLLWLFGHWLFIIWTLIIWTLAVFVIAELQRPEEPPSGAPYSYRKENVTHELIFSWLSWQTCIYFHQVVHIIKRTLPEDMNFMFSSVAREMSHSFSAFTRGILFLPLEHKVHTFSPKCNIFYVFCCPINQYDKRLFHCN